MKTSGKTGLHVLTPWTQEGGFDEARAWALELAENVAEAMPERATVEIRKAKRGDRVYIDVLQNARGHHAVPPYVLRAVPGATISTPLDWKEVTDRPRPRGVHGEEGPRPVHAAKDRSVRRAARMLREKEESGQGVSHGLLHRHFGLELRPPGGRPLPEIGVEPGAAGEPTCRSHAVNTASIDEPQMPRARPPCTKQPSSRPSVACVSRDGFPAP